MQLLSKEELKDIPNYEGLYAATTTGRVWSYPKCSKDTAGRGSSHSGRWVLGWTDPLGYQKIELVKEGIVMAYGVHRLVAMAFIVNPNNAPEVL